MRRFLPSLFLAALVSACSDSPVAPAQSEGFFAAAIAPGDMTVQLLPVPAGWDGGARAVSGNGTIFGINIALAARPLVAWSPPYASLPVTVAASGPTTIPGTGDGDNDLGDVPAFAFGGGAKGVWLQGAPGIWSFVAHPAGGYNDVMANGLNNAREMVGYISVPLPTGGNALEPVFFAGPGAVPLQLPLPSDPSFVGGMADAINNFGDIAGRVTQNVGSGRTATQRFRAALWHRTGPGSWTVELLPSATTTGNSNVHGINDSGQMVGYDGTAIVRWEPNGSGGWIRQTVITSGSRSQIDACGRITGTAPIGGKNDRAFVWDGSLTVLPLPSGALTTYAFDFAADPSSGRGVIVGWGQGKGNGRPYPVRWTIPGCP